MSTGEVDGEILDALAQHLTSTSSSDYFDRIPAAVVLSGLDEQVHDVVSDGLETILEDNNVQLVRLQKRQCINLQSALRNMIKGVISAHSGPQTHLDLVNRHKRLIPLNSDLELLRVFISENSLDRVVISLAGVETFDVHVLNELVQTVHAWNRTISFSLILGITSTRQLFERRLSKTCLSYLKAKEFDFRPKKTILGQYLASAQEFVNDEDIRIFLAPNTITSISDLATRQGGTGHSFMNMLRYIYLSHFATNPLAILARQTWLDFDEVDRKCLCQAIRNTTSFRNYCQSTLETRDQIQIELVRELLDDDHKLFIQAESWIRDGSTKIQNAVTISNTCAELDRALTLSQSESSIRNISTRIFAQMLGLDDGEIFEELQHHIVESDSSHLTQALEGLDDKVRELLGLHDLANSLHEISGPPNGIKARKTPTKAKSVSTEQSLKTKIKSALLSGLETGRIDMKDLVLHEAYLVSNKVLRFKSSFESQPRTAIERALVNPSDYLEEQQESRSVNGQPVQSVINPAASCLFTLLQEAPTIINVRDLFDAFISRFDPGQDEDHEDTNRISMSVFYRSLAEMKTMGFVKSSAGTQIKRGAKSRAHKTATHDIDYVAKTSWAML